MEGKEVAGSDVSRWRNSRWAAQAAGGVDGSMHHHRPSPLEVRWRRAVDCPVGCDKRAEGERRRSAGRASRAQPLLGQATLGRAGSDGLQSAVCGFSARPSRAATPPTDVRKSRLPVPGLFLGGIHLYAITSVAAIRSAGVCVSRGSVLMMAAVALSALTTATPQ